MEGLTGVLFRALQSAVGTILAYAAASAKEETFQGDLESVFDAIFGYNVNEGQNFC